MAKRPTTNKPPHSAPAQVLLAGIAPGAFDGLRDAFLATVTWPADTLDTAKLLAVETLNGFIGYFAEHAGAAGLIAPASDAPADHQVAPTKGSVEIVVIGPKEGRYRAGRHFTADPSAPFFVTADELERFTSDPKLSVSRTGKIAD